MFYAVCDARIVAFDATISVMRYATPFAMPDLP
jgi:hypothetical protein